MFRAAALIAVFIFGSQLEAQTAIRFLEQPKAFALEAGPVSYFFGVNPRNELQHIYWGKRLWRDADIPNARTGQGWASFDLSPTTTPDEYPAWGGGRFYETCLKLTRADGGRDVVLKYVAHSIKGDTLEVTTKDMNDAIWVTLTYRVYPEGIVERRSARNIHRREVADALGRISEDSL